MGAENLEEFNAALEGPEALIAFKERNWPVFRNVTATSAPRRSATSSTTSTGVR